MIEIREVNNRTERRRFLAFPNDLYKDNPWYVPALLMDERKIFRKDYVYNDTCEAVYYNAYKDGKIAGRISGIIQHAANTKYNEKRMRFTRFDAIEDFEVAKALFEAVEKWGVSKGMDTICGPLGFSDLEREGLLIEGFDQPQTYEEQYNAAYYPEFIDRLGYAKEVDWTESKITAPKDYDGELDKLAAFIFKRYKLRIGEARNVNDFIKKYADGLFEILDKSYDQLYGTVPFTDGMKKLMIDNFRLLISLDYVAVVVDENDKVVLFGITLPSISKAVQRSRGRLTPRCIYEILKSKAHPEIIDMALVGVDPEWLNRGVSACVTSLFVNMLQKPGVKYAETNLNLEDNYAIQNMLNRFGRENHKRRRSYVKKLNG